MKRPADKKSKSANTQKPAPQQPANPATTIHSVERLPEIALEYLLPKDDTWWELKRLECALDDKLLRNQQRLCDIQFKKERSPRRVLMRLSNSAHDQFAAAALPKPVAHSPTPIAPVLGDYAAFTPSPTSESVVQALPDTPIEVQHDASSEPKPMFANPPSWTLRLEGKLEPTVGRPSRYAPPPFTHWIKRVRAEFREPDTGAVVAMEEWTKDIRTPATDAVVIRRQGAVPLKVRLLVYPDYHVEKFQCSRALSRVIDPQEEDEDDNIEEDTGDSEEEEDFEPLVATKAHVIVLLWQYIKLHKLQLQEKSVQCDAALQRVFNGANKIALSDIPVLINEHLSPPEPIILDYQLRLDVSEHSSSVVHPLYVEYDESTLRAPRLNHPALLTLANDISALDRRIQETVELLKVAVANHRTLRDFADDPSRTIERLLREHCQDVSLLTGTPQPGQRNQWASTESWTREDVWHGPHIEYALLQYCQQHL